MNDLQRLAKADPAEEGGYRDVYRERVIAYIANEMAESLLQDGKAAYWYIRDTEEQSLRQLCWAGLIDELRSRFAGDEDSFELINLEQVTVQ